MKALTVSHADTPKGGSTTVEVIAWALTQLHKSGVDVANCQLHVQLDNTASPNQNNTLIAFLGWLVFFGLVSSFTANFLRIGHTHEDIDQFFGDVSQS